MYVERRVPRQNFKENQLENDIKVFIYNNFKNIYFEISLIK